MKKFFSIPTLFLIFHLMYLSAEPLPEDAPPVIQENFSDYTPVDSRSQESTYISTNLPPETLPDPPQVLPSESLHSLSLLSLRRNQGESLGSRLSYTTLENMFFPFFSPNIWPFLDLRAHCFDSESQFAANIGLGCRFAPACTNQVFGINLYYDCRNAYHSHFNQIGLGFEILGCAWNFRLNGYLPVGKKNYFQSCCFFDEYEGDYFYLQERFIDGLAGLDFEVESCLLDMCWGEIYFAVGGYYYKGRNCQKDIYGSEYRVTTEFCNYFSFDVVATCDSAFKTRVQAQLTFTLPLGNICQGDPRFFEPVRRQEIIVLRKRSRSTWNW